MQEIEDARIDTDVSIRRACATAQSMSRRSISVSGGSVDIGAVDREAGDDLLQGAVQNVVGEIRCAADASALARPASRASTFSSLAISFSMMRSLHSRTIAENGSRLAGEVGVSARQALLRRQDRSEARSGDWRIHSRSCRRPPNRREATRARARIFSTSR